MYRKIDENLKLVEYYKNAKMLLESYRTVNFYIDDRMTNFEDVILDKRRKRLQDTVLSVLEIDNFINTKKIEDELIDVNTTIIILNLMELALKRLYKYPRRGEIYARLLDHRYFNKEKLTCEQIVSKLNISRSYYFKLHKEAIKNYANMLFGLSEKSVYEKLTNINNSNMIREIISPYVAK